MRSVHSSHNPQIQKRQRQIRTGKGITMMRVLIVDDDDVVRMMLQEALSEAGYDVTSVSDGRQALDAIRQDGCRLVVSDWQMPRMTGVDLCRAVRGEDIAGY